TTATAVSSQEDSKAKIFIPTYQFPYILCSSVVILFLERKRIKKNFWRKTAFCLGFVRVVFRRPTSTGRTGRAGCSTTAGCRGPGRGCGQTGPTPGTGG